MAAKTKMAKTKKEAVCTGCGTKIPKGSIVLTQRVGLGKAKGTRLDRWCDECKTTYDREDAETDQALDSLAYVPDVETQAAPDVPADVGAEQGIIADETQPDAAPDDADEPAAPDDAAEPEPADEPEEPERDPAPMQHALRDALRCDMAVVKLSVGQDKAKPLLVVLPRGAPVPQQALVELDSKVFELTLAGEADGCANYSVKRFK